MHVVVNTPTGHVGGRVAAGLLDAGATVTAIHRAPERIAALAERGAIVVAGSTDDPDVLERALADADALLWVTPPNLDQGYREWALGCARAAVAAARKHNVQRAVVLSSIGAQHGPGTGPVGALRDVEEAFEGACSDLVVLRPGYFMENLEQSLPAMVERNLVVTPLPPDKELPMVATRDIAAVALRWLADEEWSGQRVVGVHGPEDIDAVRATAILAEALARPLRYAQASLEETRAAMLAAGISAAGADLVVELYEAIADGRLDPDEPRTKETTTPTTLAQWAREELRPKVEALERVS
jgi:uncharacterized protein YbjT (DUF2867 family)